MNNNAYITLLSTNNYLYGCIGLMYSWKATNSKYPFYCVVTEDITKENIEILKAIGYHVIEDNRYIPNSYLEILKKYEETGIYETPVGESKSDLQKNGWQHCWSKLRLFSYTQFDKLLYLDADTYVIQNLDDMFDRPGWSSICEYDYYIVNTFRFHTAFLLIEPNQKEYNEIIQLAEENPLIVHPATNQAQLSNDYDLLNLYKNDWHEHPELVVPSYTYVDSYCFTTADHTFPFIINSFMKMKAIHLTGPKPWLAGSQQVQDYCGDWGLLKELYLIYIKFLNKALVDIHIKGIASLPLVK